ncbi:MAG: hypothetical protein WC728_00445 [Elusimicrobiota bacterium]
MNKIEFASTASFPARFLTLGFMAVFFFMDMTASGDPGWPMRLMVLLFCGSVGFGAYGTLLDRSSGQAVTWVGFNIPFLANLRPWRKSRPLSLYSEAVVRYSRVTEGKGFADVYRLLLSGSGPKLPLEDFSSRQAARVRCIEVAKTLGIDMLDSSGSSPERRRADELDDSLRAARLRKPAQGQPPALPALSALRSEATPEGLRVLIPAPGFKRRHAGYLAGAAALAAFIGLLGWGVAYAVSHRAGSGGAFALTLFGSAAALLLSAGLYPGLRAALVRDELRVSTGGVRLTRRLLFLSWTWTMPADDILHLEVGGSIQEGGLGRLPTGGSALHVFGRKRTLSFGYGLSRAELDWLLGTIADCAGS